MGHKVLLTDTALPGEELRFMMMQEVVRQIQNCGRYLPTAELNYILLRFAQKMVNSRHRQMAVKITLV